MSLACVLGHRWDGCRCGRCGKMRDHEHDWENIECRIKCRRCGLIRGLNHGWEGCRCRHCGAERHYWQEGICTNCGEKCAHPASADMWDSQFSHWKGQMVRVCKRCGTSVGIN